MNENLRRLQSRRFEGSGANGTVEMAAAACPTAAHRQRLSRCLSTHRVKGTIALVLHEGYAFVTFNDREVARALVKQGKLQHLFNGACTDSAQCAIYS